MTGFELITPFVALFLVLASAAVLFFALRIECRLAARKRINLNNYRAKMHLFFAMTDAPLAVFAGACGLGSLVMGVIVLFHPVVSLYAIAFFLLVATNGVAAFLALNRKKYARDLRLFDAYYVKVADLLAGKARTEMELSVCRKRVSELSQKLTATIGSFNKNLTEPISGEFMPVLFDPINEMLGDYERDLARVSGAIEADFNEALAAFLHDNVEPELRVLPVRYFDEVTVDELLAEIKTSYAARIGAMVIDEVERGSVANAKALANIMKLFHGLGIKPDNETLARFLRAAAVYNDRGELAAALYADRQIPATLVREVLIPENTDWAFAPGMAAAFNARELTAILSDLLELDRSSMCYLLLSQFNASQKRILEEALGTQQEAVSNAAIRQAKAFCLILGTEYAVGNKASIHENLALMLAQHGEEAGLSRAEREKIADIVREESYVSRSGEIAALYQQATAHGALLCESTKRVLLQYVMNPSEARSFFDEGRLVALLGEYCFTLSFTALSVLRDLVGGYLLCTASDEDVLGAVKQEFITLPTFVLPTEHEQASVFGKRVIDRLATDRAALLRCVIYRCESERQTLDRVLSLCKGGE